MLGKCVYINEPNFRDYIKSAFITYFKLGAIYDYSKKNNFYIHIYYNNIHYYPITYKEFDSCFITLEEYRDLKLNKMLNG